MKVTCKTEVELSIEDFTDYLLWAGWTLQPRDESIIGSIYTKHGSTVVVPDDESSRDSRVRMQKAFNNLIRFESRDALSVALDIMHGGLGTK
jgi:hypothetical protein